MLKVEGVIHFLLCLRFAIRWHRLKLVFTLLVALITLPILAVALLRATGSLVTIVLSPVNVGWRFRKFPSRQPTKQSIISPDVANTTVRGVVTVAKANAPASVGTCASDTRCTQRPVLFTVVAFWVDKQTTT